MTSFDTRPAGAIGRRARLDLEFEPRRSGTALAHAYAEPPFRVGRWFTHGAAAYLILASSGPGVFGGDSFQQHVRVRAGARVRLTTQSSLQVHPNPDRTAAGWLAEYDVEPDTILHCDWHPTIPFARSALDQRITLRVAAGARVFWSDAFMAGRVGSGERWAFEALRHELRLSRAGTLVYMERAGIEPVIHQPAQPWIAGNAGYFGTVLVTGREPHEIERQHARLQAVPDICAAADMLEDGVGVIRLTAPADPAGGAAFHRARDQIAATLGWLA